MAEIEISEVRSIPSSLEGRQGKMDRLVFYRVDKGPTQIVRVPDEGFTASTVEAAIKKELEHRGKVVGHTFKL